MPEAAEPNSLLTAVSSTVGPTPDIVVTEDVWGVALERLSETYPVVRRPDAWQSPEALRRSVSSARGLVVRNRTVVDRTLLEAGRRLEIVARAGVGLDNIDVTAADELGIVVVAALGANARSVAEHTLALALALARDITGNDHRVRSGEWDRRLGRELAGRTWGVVGLGATGAAVAAVASAVGMQVVGFDPYQPADTLPSGVDERVTALGELLDRADVVSLHLPLTPETAGMVGAGFLKAMRSGSYLINVSRGGLVGEDALADALDAGHLAGAGLDVRTTEPPSHGRLDTCERVILSPHVAGLTHEAQDQVATMLADDLALVFGGADARHAVGKWCLPHR